MSFFDIDIAAITGRMGALIVIILILRAFVKW